MKQLDRDHDQRLLGRFALGLPAEIDGAPLATTAHSIASPSRSTTAIRCSRNATSMPTTAPPWPSLRETSGHGADQPDRGHGPRGQHGLVEYEGWRQPVSQHP